MFWDWLSARLGESTTWLGIAAFFGMGVGPGLVTAGYPQAGAIIGAIGGGFGAVGATITREKGGMQK